MLLAGCDGNDALGLVRDDDHISGREDVGVVAQARKLGIRAVLPDRPPVRESVLRRDSGEGLALLDDVRQNMACLGIRSNWQLVAIDELGLLASPSPPPGRSRGRPITTKPSRNRQDSGDG